MKEKIRLSTVEETLLIPLYMRAKESRRKDAILHDNLACKLVESIDYDFKKFDKSSMSALGCVIRGRYFDYKVKNFIEKKTAPIVVNIGCGLDTRYQRLNVKQGTVFYELDLPEVMQLRERLFPPYESNDIPLAASLLETEWMDQLRSKHPDSYFIFTIEGVLMYFYEKQVKALLEHLATRFPGGEIHFDLCGTMFTKKKVKNDSVKHTNAYFRCGIDDGKIIEEWIPQLTMIENHSYMDFEKKRWGIMGVLLRCMPQLSRKFSSIVGYEIKESPKLASILISKQIM